MTMKTHTTKLISLIPVFLAAVIVGCGEQEQQTTQETVNSVNVALVKQGDYRVQQSFTGSVEGAKQADIFSKVSEAVEAVGAYEGQSVKSGQVLVSFDKTGPSSAYREAESVYRNAEKNFKRMEFLYKEGAVSESQFDAARTEYEVNKASFEAAASLVEVKSPIDGVVTSLAVRSGDYVSAGQKLATVATVERLRINFGVSAREVAFFEKGAQVEVSAEGIEAVGTGTVSAVAKSADPVSRAFQIEVLMDNDGRKLSPGMFVRVSVTLDELTDRIVVPRSTIVTLDGQPVAFVVENGTAVKRPLQLGRDLNGQVVVQSGLTVGDTLVVVGQNYLDDGFSVRIIEMETID